MMEFPRHKPEEAAKYNKFRWWLGITLGDVFDKTADLYPRKEAIIDGSARISYSELRERVDRLAAGLINLGIEKGDTVLLQLPNWVEFVYAYFALQKTGAIPVILISGYPLRFPLFSYATIYEGTHSKAGRALKNNE